MARTERRNLVRKRIVRNKAATCFRAELTTPLETPGERNCAETDQWEKSSMPARAASIRCPMRYRRIETEFGFAPRRRAWPVQCQRSEGASGDDCQIQTIG